MGLALPVEPGLSLGVMMARRFDAVVLAGKMERTSEGYLKGDAVVTRTGVFPYRQPDGSVRRELRHPDEVFSASSLATMALLPVTLGHPVSDDNPTGMVTAENAKALSIGSLGERVHPDGALVNAPLVIRDKTAIDEIESGASRENSMGYETDLVVESGVYDGVEYDAKQTNIRYNHLAIVPRGRAGAVARLNLDEADALQVNEDDGTDKTKEDTMALVKVKLDNGLTYDAAQEVSQEMDRLRGDLADAKVKLDGLTEVKLDGKATGTADAAVAAHASSLQGKLDAATEQIEKLKAEGPKATMDAAKERVRLLQIGASVLDADTVKKLDDMDDGAIKKAVILASVTADKRDAVKTKLDAQDGDSGAAYVDARFDAVAETVNLRDSGAINRQHLTIVNADNHDGSNAPDADKARQDMIDRQTGKATSKKEG